MSVVFPPYDVRPRPKERDRYSMSPFLKFIPTPRLTKARLLAGTGLVQEPTPASLSITPTLTVENISHLRSI